MLQLAVAKSVNVHTSGLVHLQAGVFPRVGTDDWTLEIAVFILKHYVPNGLLEAKASRPIIMTEDSILNNLLDNTHRGEKINVCL